MPDTTMSRRRMLGALGTTAIAVGLTPGLATRALAAPAPQLPSLHDIAAQIGTTFEFHAAGTTTRLTLHEATAIPARSQKGGPVTGEAYSLVFGGSALPAGVYDVRHRRLGSFVLYVGPVDRGLLGPAHQAVVNRQRVGS